MKVISKNKNNPKKPFISFQKNQHITFFTSFESMNEADPKKWLNCPQKSIYKIRYSYQEIICQRIKKANG